MTDAQQVDLFNLRKAQLPFSIVQGDCVFKVEDIVLTTRKNRTNSVAVNAYMDANSLTICAVAKFNSGTSNYPAAKVDIVQETYKLSDGVVATIADGIVVFDRKITSLQASDIAEINNLLN